MDLSNKLHYYFSQKLTHNISKTYKLFIEVIQESPLYVKSHFSDGIAYDNFVAFRKSLTHQNTQVVNLRKRFHY